VSAALNLSILPKSAADDKMNIEGQPFGHSRWPRPNKQPKIRSTA
jgi:hypothetical protein